MQPFSYEVRTGPDRTTVVLRGDIDIASTAQLAAAGTALLGDEAVRALDVDCAEVSFAGSAALGVLVAWNNLARERGVPLALHRVPPRMRRIFAITGLSGTIPVRD